uniref:DnaJ (Hsp40) homolog, subfamily C, member 13 n=1 Tax=Nothobranchius kuhntae TaxID=321403 RepID=A0A1A8JGA7_NOTKU
MNVVKDNKDLACFYTTKHSWRGKYKRVFSVGTHGITTYNPTTLEVTNQWPYGDICGIGPVGRGQGTEFSLTFRKGSGKKSETLKFSTEHRTELLTEALRFRTEFSEGKITGRRYNCYKHHWSDTRKPVSLEVTPGGIDQIDPHTNRVVCSYDYRNIEGFVEVSDYQGGFSILYGGFSRLHLFASENRDDIIRSAIEHAGNFIGITLRLRKEALSFEGFVTDRLGKYSSDDSITSLAEFVVQKITTRHPEPVKRIFALTETCLVERDPASYNIVTIKPFGEVFALICDVDNPQVFTVEFIRGQIRKYSSTERDSLLASLLDGVRASGNRDVCVKMASTQRGQRWGLLSMPVDEEVESLHLRFLAAPPSGNFADAVFRFNANISYSGVLHAVTQDGLFSENKEKLINNAILSLLSQEGELPSSNSELESHFQAIRRLVASKAGFQAFTQLPKFREKLGVKTVKALKRNNNGVTHAAIDTLCALMCPMHDDYDLRQEQLNKASLLSSKKFLENLLEKFITNVDHGTGALVISSLLDFLTFALCAPYSETTDGQQFDMLLEMVAANGRTLFKLFQHPSMAIVKGAGLVMKAIIEEGEKEIATKMQELALSEGALPRHLHTSLFTISADQRMLTNRQLSRHLVGLWTAENPVATNLLKRILPTGLLAYLDSSDPVPERDVDRMHIRDNLKIASDQLNRNKVPEWQRIAGKAAKEVEKFAKEKADLVLMHWRDKMGIAQKEKEWYFGNADKERRGPFSFEEMQEFWNTGVLNAKTRCWAQGMDGWRPLQAIPQLKWCLLATGQSVMNESDLATMILNMLITMCSYYPSRDQDNAIIRPLPKIKRMISDNACLPHIVQLLLTFDPILVEKVANLLFLVMQDNPNLQRLYLTGVFFFIMMYTGSNVLPVARFLKYTHLKQAFKSEESKGQDIVQRSILGPVLPEAMVCYLENYEAEGFSEIFLGEFDTPEAIWSSEMRRMMIEKIAAHIADFSPRLQSNTRALYQYCPIPVISFPQLDNELFCNIYYLRHLCDTIHFPNWPIRDAVKLLKDTLEAWKKEVEKKPPSMSVDDAYEVLNLPKGQGQHEESKIRKAYFRLAQKYHPDKNPEGRDMFEKVNKAYEFLCTKSARIVDGPDPENIILILKAQSILFNRHKQELEPYKYAGYPMLIKTIKMETDDEQLFSKASPLLPAAAELAFHTVNCSALNAEELRRESGIEILLEALSRCVAVLTASSRPEDMAVQVCGHICRCYSVAAQFEECREKIIELPNIIRDLCHILYYGKGLPKTAALAVQCVSSFAVDFFLQTHLFHAGVLWHLLVHLFNYDYTLEESGVQASQDTNQQEVANSLAKLSLVAVSRLGGYAPMPGTPDAPQTNGMDGTPPENPTVRKSLAAMLTPYISRKLGLGSPAEVLKLLNSNSENPYLIWNNGTRAELLEFLEGQQEGNIKRGENDKSFGANFVFDDHGKELIVGEIFVRVYNEQPSFPLEYPKAFAASLLDYVGSQAQYLHTLLAMSHSNKVESQQHAERLNFAEMALEALRNVIKNNPGSESECIGHFKLLFSLLRVHGAGRVQQLVLEVVNTVTSNQECVSNIADSLVLSNLLLLLHSLPSSRQIVLETLHALTSNTKIVKEAMAKGALIYLLDLFCNCTHPQVRTQTAELFSKMTSDKLVGPKVRLTLMRFLPGVFMDAMRDNAEAAVQIFEGTHENPELIWNDTSREKVSTTVREMMLEHFKQQKDNPDVSWKLPEDFTVAYGSGQGELEVGGVFLRIFIAQPGWVLRKPREFLVSLLETLSELLEKNNPNGEALETITTAAVCLFSTHSHLADQVPPLGHLPRVLAALNHKNNTVPKSSIRLIHVLSENELCVRSMASLETIGPLMAGMRVRADMAGLACEALNRMFQKEQTELVAQALRVELVPYLLRLLEGIGLETLENPSATKAQIVKALKSMTRSLQYGEQVNEILAKSSVWSAFKDQKHDLFISESQTAGYLTGPGVAGYLTAGTGTTVLSSVPPPVDNNVGDQG